MADPTNPLARFVHPLAPLARLRGDRKPHALRIADEAWVAFAGPEGRGACVRDRCPHRFAPLSAGRLRPDGRLACAYHGWHFDARGHGCSPSQPSLRACDVDALECFEALGWLWGAAPGADRDALGALDWPDWEYAGAFETPFAAPLYVCLDNFSEDEHTPWVHDRLGWSPEDTSTIEFECERREDESEVYYRARQRPSRLARPFGIRNGDIFHNRWVTRFDPVRTLYEIWWTDPSGRQRRPLSMRANIFMLPEDERTTRFVSFLFVRAEGRAAQLTLPALKPLALELVKREIEADARFIPTVAETPESMRGMRLGKFDAALVHNRRLLRRIYWGKPADDAVEPEFATDEAQARAVAK